MYCNVPKSDGDNCVVFIWIPIIVHSHSCSIPKQVHDRTCTHFVILFRCECCKTFFIFFFQYPHIHRAHATAHGSVNSQAPFIITTVSISECCLSGLFENLTSRWQYGITDHDHLHPESGSCSVAN